ncbi:sugar phosphate isomerase/epimerase [Candidatus Poribacteria bacterium]|nr:sugar phosphate isomerase/epimerase [Candidatus Poribacteria bacterium]
MKISFHGAGYFGLPFEEIVTRLANVGYDGIEPMCGPEAQLKPDELKASDRQAIKTFVAEQGMEIAVLNPYRVQSMANMAKEGKAEAFYRQLMELAADLGVPSVNFLSGFLPTGDTDGWRTLIDTLKPLTRYGESIGVCLSIHNHEANILDTPNKCNLIIQHVGSPNLKLNFDATNFHILNYNIPSAVELTAPHLIHCHLKGVVGMYPYNQFLVPGEAGDEMDFEELAKAFGSVGYNRFISVETFPHMRDDKDVVAYNMISSTLAKLGLRG